MSGSDRLYFFARFSPVDKRSFVLRRDQVTASKVCYLSTIQPEKQRDLYLLDITANMEIYTQDDGSFAPDTIDSLTVGHEYQVLDRRDDSDYVSEDETAESSESQEDAVFCEECGALVQPHELFCECGAPVITPADSHDSADYTFCEECGAILEDRSAQFCECGAVIDWASVDEQNSSESSDDDEEGSNLPAVVGELDDLLEDLDAARAKPLPPRPQVHQIEDVSIPDEVVPRESPEPIQPTEAHIEAPTTAVATSTPSSEEKLDNPPVALPVSPAIVSEIQPEVAPVVVAAPLPAVEHEMEIIKKKVVVEEIVETIVRQTEKVIDTPVVVIEEKKPSAFDVLLASRPKAAEAAATSTPVTTAPLKDSVVAPSPEVAALLARNERLKLERTKSQGESTADHSSELEAMKARLAQKAKQQEEEKRRKEEAAQAETERLDRLKELEETRRLEREKLLAELELKKQAELERITAEKLVKQAEIDEQRRLRAQEREEAKRAQERLEAELRQRDAQEAQRIEQQQQQTEKRALVRKESEKEKELKQLSPEELAKLTPAQRALYFIRLERATQPADGAPPASKPEVVNSEAAKIRKTSRSGSFKQLPSSPEGTVERVSRRKSEKSLTLDDVKGRLAAAKDPKGTPRPKKKPSKDEPSTEEPAEAPAVEVAVVEKPKRKTSRDRKSSRSDTDSGSGKSEKKGKKSKKKSQ